MTQKAAPPCKIQQKINDLLKRSSDIKKELDHTPLQEKKKIIALINRLLKTHKDLDEIKE